MTSIVRPTSIQMTRRLIVLAAAVFAVVIGYSQTLFGWGQSPSEFSADSDANLRVAGYAFSIWGLIYLGLLAYAVRQAMPATGESDLLRRLGWPSAIALMGIGWWVVAAAFDAEIATVVLIFGSLLALLIPLLVEARTIRRVSRKDREFWLVASPLALLAGWLTIASPVNLLTVATGNGWLPDSPAPTTWSVLAIVATALMALGVTFALRLLAYALPIAWGLLGVFVAEQARGNGSLAYIALGAAVAVLVGAVILTFRLRPAIARASPGPANGR